MLQGELVRRSIESHASSSVSRTNRNKLNGDTTMSMNVLGFAAHSALDALTPYRFERRDSRPDDVVIEILYCGVCHSDLHQVRNDWGGSSYPLVPGHEIFGRVVSVGSDVTPGFGPLPSMNCSMTSARGYRSTSFPVSGCSATPTTGI